MARSERCRLVGHARALLVEVRPVQGQAGLLADGGEHRQVQRVGARVVVRPQRQHPLQGGLAVHRDDDASAVDERLASPGEVARGPARGRSRPLPPRRGRRRRPSRGRRARGWPTGIRAGPPRRPAGPRATPSTPRAPERAAVACCSARVRPAERSATLRAARSSCSYRERSQALWIATRVEPGPSDPGSTTALITTGSRPEGVTSSSATSSKRPSTCSRGARWVSQ